MKETRHDLSLNTQFIAGNDIRGLKYVTVLIRKANLFLNVGITLLA